MYGAEIFMPESYSCLKLLNQLNISFHIFAHLTVRLLHILRAEHSDDYLFKILTTVH